MQNEDGKFKSIKLAKSDLDLVKKLHKVTGIRSFSDLMRLALRSLAESKNVAA